MRRAFLSNASSGEWQPAPSDMTVRKHLSATGYLRSDTASKMKVLKAMMRYSKDQTLPSLKTYNGLVWQINRSLTLEDPTRRELIDLFARLGR
mmetsp:Transcript_35152/g.78856  ORF Transcript_35152/g.78856 Transcript_35152/m.78856 type:complete len:93 (-) Transcript_35152:56-334(-)